MAVSAWSSSSFARNTQKRKFPAQQLGIIMPAAVIMEENFDKLLEQCEAQELEVSAEQGDVLSLTF